MRHMQIQFLGRTETHKKQQRINVLWQRQLKSYVVKYCGTNDTEVYIYIRAISKFKLENKRGNLGAGKMHDNTSATGHLITHGK